MVLHKHIYVVVILRTEDLTEKLEPLEVSHAFGLRGDFERADGTDEDEVVLEEVLADVLIEEEAGQVEVYGFD